MKAQGRASRDNNGERCMSFLHTFIPPPPKCRFNRLPTHITYMHRHSIYPSLSSHFWLLINKRFSITTQVHDFFCCISLATVAIT